MPRREGPLVEASKFGPGGQQAGYLDCGDAKMGESREPNLSTYSRYISYRASVGKY